MSVDTYTAQVESIKNLTHDVRRLDTAVIHVNPCGHAGEDPHALTRHHEPDRQVVAR